MQDANATAMRWNDATKTCTNVLSGLQFEFLTNFVGASYNPQSQVTQLPPPPCGRTIPHRPPSRPGFIVLLHGVKLLRIGLRHFGSHLGHMSWLNMAEYGRAHFPLPVVNKLRSITCGGHVLCAGGYRL